MEGSGCASTRDREDVPAWRRECRFARTHDRAGNDSRGQAGGRAYWLPHERLRRTGGAPRFHPRRHPTQSLHPKRQVQRCVQGRASARPFRQVSRSSVLPRPTRCRAPPPGACAMRVPSGAGRKNSTLATLPTAPLSGFGHGAAERWREEPAPPPDGGTAGANNKEAGERRAISILGRPARDWLPTLPYFMETGTETWVNRKC